MDAVVEIEFGRGIIENKHEQKLGCKRYQLICSNILRFEVQLCFIILNSIKEKATPGPRWCMPMLSFFAFDI